MIKKVITCLSLFFLLNCAVMMGQMSSTVAYVNTKELLNAIPEVARAKAQIETLNENYQAEFKVMESDYNKKYADYISYQATLAETIKLRRMQELTELESRMNEFIRVAQKDIEEQERLLVEPLKERIREAVKQVGLEQNFSVIYDMANESILFVNPQAVDANPLVRQKLGIR